MLMHIAKSMHLVEMMNFLLFIITNLSSLFLLYSQRYQNHKKRNGETRPIGGLEEVNYKEVFEDLQPQEVDGRVSISQAPKLQETPQPQELVSIPTQAPKGKTTVGSFDSPYCRGSRYGIHPPKIEAHDYKIKASLIGLIQKSKFLGTKVENPYEHLDSFERLCDLFRTGGVPHDIIKLILFPFSLGGEASQWERTLPSHLVNSWEDCKKIFINKFYSTQKTVQIRKDISNFKQGMHESFHEAWERLKGYIRDCPHHGFKKGAILSIFYLGVDQEHQWTLDVASHGRFANLTVEQGELLVENFAQSKENHVEDFGRSTRIMRANEEQRMIKALHEKIDKQALMIDKLLHTLHRSVHLIDKLEDNQGGNEFVDFAQQEVVDCVVNQGQAPTSTPNELDLTAMCQLLLKGQVEATSVCDDLTSQLQTLASKINDLEDHAAHRNPISNGPMEKLKGKFDETSQDHCHAIFSSEHSTDDEEEEVMRDFAQLLYDSPLEDTPPSPLPSILTKDIENQSEGGTLGTNDLVVVEDKDESTTQAMPKSLPKLGNPGKFSLSCSLGELDIKDALCDSGSSVNVMSLEMLGSLGIRNLVYHPSPITFGDASSRKPIGLLEDFPLKIGDCIVPTDFVVMKMKKKNKLPLLLGTPFLNTTGASMDFKNKKVVLLNVDDKVYYPMKESPIKLCGVLTIEDEECHDKEAQAPRIETVGCLMTVEMVPPTKVVCEKVAKASPPKASKKKKESNVKDALGYGNVEEAWALDGACLESLFSTTMEEEKESTKIEGNRAKMKKQAKYDLSPFANKEPREWEGDNPLLDQPSIMTLTPWKHEDGIIEYKIKCKGRSKPFASVRAFLTPEFKNKGQAGLQEIMSNVLKLELKDPPGKSTTPPQLH